MKDFIKKLLREGLMNEESIQDFLLGKGKFLYHGTNINPSEFILDDDYNASEEEGNSPYSCDIPDGVLFLTNDIREANAYGKYIIPCELPRKNIKVFKIDTDAPSIVWDDDFCGYSDYGMFEQLYNGYDAVEVRGRNKSTFVAHINAIKPRTDLAIEYYSKSLKEDIDTNTKKQYIGQCDLLRRKCTDNEEYWQAMMDKRKKISFKKFLDSVDMRPMLDDENDDPIQHIKDSVREDPETAAYSSVWGNEPAMFLQVAGFEFIFV